MWWDDGGVSVCSRPPSPPMWLQEGERTSLMIGGRPGGHQQLVGPTFPFRLGGCRGCLLQLVGPALPWLGWGTWLG